MNKRNNTYDLLKAIGLVFIMIAHCTNKPEGLEYIRNFEVILLVLVSAMLSYEKYNELYKWSSSTTQIIFKRLKRLVVPTWFFLGMFFIAIFCVTHIKGIAFPYSKRVVIESFLMINGIGYVWIMLVYCWITVGLPFLFLGFNRLKLSAYGKTVILACSFIVYELIRHLILNCEGTLAYYCKNTVLYLIGYSLLSFLPYALKKYANYSYLTQGIGFVLAHVVCLIIAIMRGDDTVSLMAITKYPPSFFYYSYGLGVSLIIYSVLSRVSLSENSVVTKTIRVFGKHSQWIYFNHILAIYIFNEFVGIHNWLLMFVFIFTCSLLILAIERVMVMLLSQLGWKKTREIASFLVGEKI